MNSKKPVLVTIDLETYYDKEYSLSKITMEEYIRDDRFEVIGVAVKVGDGETQWSSGTHDEIANFLAQFDWAHSMVLAHNCAFDAAILNWRYGIRPRALADTMSMGNALGDGAGSVSLAALAKQYKLGEKGTEVVKALGKRRLDFTPEELTEYGKYCVNDVELCYRLFEIMLRQGFPAPELKLIDMTLRMFTEPVFELDADLLEQHLAEVKAKKQQLLDGCGIDQKVLMSNNQLADKLRELGVEPPVKISKATGKETYAFAKTDEVFKNLPEALPEESPMRFIVEAIVAARIGTKSTLEETRTERFIGISQRGKLPVPIKYCGAKTKRWSGEGGGINMQNLPRKSPLKAAIRAPAGKVIVGADLSNIELRIGLWFGGMKSKLEELRTGKDLYRDFASMVFGVDYSAVTPDQRFIGKTCIAEGTLVLSDSGWKPIEQVLLSDKLWDGKEWVCHQGLVSNGLKETLPICGAWLTPDHLVWSGKSWQEAISLINDESILRQSLGTAAENLPSQAFYKGPKVGSRPLLSDATALAMSTLLTATTSRTSKAHGVYGAREPQVQPSDIGGISAPSQTTNTAEDSSVGLLQRLTGAITTEIKRTTITVLEGLRSLASGLMIGGRSYDMPNSFQDGTSLSSIWTAPTTIKDTNRATFVLSQKRKTQTTGGVYTSLRRNALALKKKLSVYDIASVGPRNRFTILTDAGPLIVHNCQLALIYGTGAKKLREAIKIGSGMDIGLEEATRIVKLYRSTYSGVVNAWHDGKDVLEAMLRSHYMEYGPNGVVKVHGQDGILLPSGLFMQFPELTKVVRDDGNPAWAYKSRKGVEYTHGAKMFQATCQALARCQMGDGMLRTRKNYPVALTVHDAEYFLAPEADGQVALDFAIEQLCVPPVWAPDLPLAAEGGFGRTLKEC